MLYRNFAIATLLAAPLIVMATQSFTPHHQSPEQDDVPRDVAPPPVPVPVAPPVSSSAAPSGTVAPVAPASSFGQPMAGADQPALAPGAGLPDTSAPPLTGGLPAGFSPREAPAGSPNAE